MLVWVCGFFGHEWDGRSRVAAVALLADSDYVPAELWLGIIR